METDVEKLYCSLNELLQDICKFLSSEKIENLSPKDQKLVQSLINRSKKQLQDIAKVQASQNNEEYVVMDKKDDINANVETPVIQEKLVYHYIDLPAKDASQSVKYGFISMKRKILLGFEKMKRVYACIHNEWLIVYGSEKDSKPVFTFNLKNYEAREADSDKNTNFELMSTIPDQKMYYFMALTRKDMLQWVVQINKCHDRSVLRNKEIDNKMKNDISPMEEDIMTYDAIIPQSNYDKSEPEIDEEENIYHELDTVKSNINGKIKPPTIKDIENKPPLPGRRPSRRTLPKPVAPPLPPANHSSEESLASYDDIDEIVQDKSPKASTQSFDDSFSDDEEDSTYEQFINVKARIEAAKSNRAPEENIIANTAKSPILLLKPKVKEKPLMAKKPSYKGRTSSVTTP